MNSRKLLVTVAFAAGLGVAAPPVVAAPVVMKFGTELVSMNLSGTALMPFASDPDNLLGDSIGGYGFVNSSVTLTLSSQRAISPGPTSLGSACASEAPAVPPSPCQSVGAVDPTVLNGESFQVDSFFDLYFDITFTDADASPGRDYAGMPVGASLVLVNNGPARITSSYGAVFDKNAPQFGLLPSPESSPFEGGVNFEIPLGVDINANGENDKIKFTLMLFALLDANRTFITLPDGTVIFNVDTRAELTGAVLDESVDPPFGPLTLTGPTTATSRLTAAVPEPATLALIGLGLAGLGFSRRKQ